MAPSAERSDLETVLAYHERTKHRPDRFARSAGFLDWETQPVPFRFYEPTESLPLDEIPPGQQPEYEALFRPGGIGPQSVNRESVSRLFYDSLALSAWKEQGAARWTLRVNPSSGNLHPTEGYLIAGPVPDLRDGPVLYHYSPYRHALEIRAELSPESWRTLLRGLPPDTLFVGLTSIHWRESWKYGERAFRYCQHDLGHAVAAVSLAAAAMGWTTRLVDRWSDEELNRLLGVADQSGPEAEHADCLLAIHAEEGTDAADGVDTGPFPGEPPSTALSPELRGLPNRLSPSHHPWPVIDEVARACLRGRGEPGRASVDDPDHEPTEPLVVPPAGGSALPARELIRRRRSAVAMDGATGLDRDSFHRVLARTLPAARRPPFPALPWRAAIHLLLFVHRVEGVRPGLYALPRGEAARGELEAAFRADFEWRRPVGTPGGLPLYLLRVADVREAARMVSCGQEIAADGAFAVAMIGEFDRRLRKHGASFYKRLHWEAGAVGQLLYLEAEAAGLRGTGIGCYFDDGVHDMVGLRDRRYQDLYHFTMGGAVEDPRLRTLPAYAHRRA